MSFFFSCVLVWFAAPKSSAKHGDDGAFHLPTDFGMIPVVGSRDASRLQQGLEHRGGMSAPLLRTKEEGCRFHVAIPTGIVLISQPRHARDDGLAIPALRVIGGVIVFQVVTNSTLQRQSMGAGCRADSFEQRRRSWQQAPALVFAVASIAIKP